MSALNSPLPSRSGTPSIEHPLAFMAQQLAHARSALRLSAQDLPDFDAETLSGTLLPESTTISLLAQLVKGLVTVSHELSGVTSAKENGYTRTHPGLPVCPAVQAHRT